jgi:hypothetical protein
MPIKRRGFVRGLILAPVVPAALSAQQAAAPAPSPATPPAAAPMRGQQPSVPKLKVTDADIVSEIHLHFFDATQMATLERLGALLMPPLKNNPGALEAHAPEFLDFLISESPAPRQKLYRDGLDHLDHVAKEKFSKPFAQLDTKEADAVVRPLLAVRYWPQDRPADHYQDFVAQAHEDLRIATLNSREWAEAAAKSGRRFTRGTQTRGMYWLPIDPVVGE